MPSSSKRNYNKALLGIAKSNIGLELVMMTNLNPQINSINPQKCELRHFLRKVSNYKILSKSVPKRYTSKI